LRKLYENKLLFLIINTVCIASFLATGCYPSPNVSFSGNQSYVGCETTVTPCSNSTFNLGTTVRYWNNLYVNNIIGWTPPVSGNVSSNGTTGWIPYFASPTALANSIMSNNGTDIAVYGNIAVTGTVDGVDVSTLGLTSHTQNTDTILTTNGSTQLINAGLLKNSLKTDRWLLTDGNTFLGVSSAGAGVLAHTVGIEGYYNTGLGFESLYNLTTGQANTGVGYYALRAITSGIYNTALGQQALGDTSTGSFNTAVGLQALTKNTGSYNTALGLMAGTNNIAGSSNVFIGSEAGKNELGSNKLYISNSDTANPLIGGDFSTRTLNIYGNVTLPSGYTVDGVDISALAAGSGNVTTNTGTVNTLPKYAGASSITNSTLSDNGTAITTTSNITTTQTLTGKQITSTATGSDPPFIVNSGAWVGNLNVDQLDSKEGTYYANINTANVTTTGGTANTISKYTATNNIQNSTITDNGSTVNIAANVTLPAGYTVDGVDISTLGASSGNVTTVGGTANTIPKFTGSTSIANSSLTDDGTTVNSSANIALASGKNLDLKKVLTVNNSWSGLTTNGTAGENLVLGDVVYKDANSKLYKADASNVAKIPGFAIATGTINADATGTFLTYGYMRYDTWTWTEHGVRIYLSATTTGAMIETPPTGANKYIQELAVIMDSVIGGGAADIIFFNPSFTYLMDTPANSDLGSAPTSNWAFDHAAASGNVTTVTGLANTITKYDSATSIARSTITDNGTVVNITSNVTLPTGYTVDGVDVSAHATRHQWNSNDALNIIYNFLSLADLTLVQGIVSSTISGAGGTAYDAHHELDLTTGAVNGNYAGLVDPWAKWFDQYGVGCWSIYFRMKTDSAVTNMEFWTGWFSDGSTYPTATSEHIGVKLINQVLSVTNAHAGVETATQIATGVGTYTNYYFLIYNRINNSAIDYYWSTDNITWTLVTHSTNIPHDVGLCEGTWTKTTSNAARRTETHGMKYAQYAPL
jgi:hypothetical protein